MSVSGISLENTYSTTVTGSTQTKPKEIGTIDVTADESNAQRVTPTTEEAVPAVNVDRNKVKQTVLGILKNANIEDKVNSDMLEKIIDKYVNMQTYAQNNGIECTDTVLNEFETRTVNYTKALLRKGQEEKFMNYFVDDEAGKTPANIEFEEVKQAILNKDLGAMVRAFKEYAAQDIELGDTNGDGALDVVEMIEMEAKDLGYDLTKDQLEELKEAVLERVALLDANNNGKIDRNEQAAYLWAMANINHKEDGRLTNADVTYQEWRNTQQGLSIYVDETGNYVPDDKDNYVKFMGAYQEGLKNF